MRLVSYGDRGSELPGAIIEDSILPLGPVLTGFGLGRAQSVRAALPMLDDLRSGIAESLDRGAELIPLAGTRLGPPVVDPPNLFVCGANYFAHLVEHGMDPQRLPTLPVVFLKPGAALSGPTDPIVRPIECRQLDYEAELAIVIGKGGRRIPAESAAEHIAGYMIANDVSSRDLGEGESKKLDVAPFYQLMRAKGWDTFLPTGPWLVTVDEAREFADVRIRTWVDDDLRQDAYAGTMATDPYHLIEWLSATTTLRPGDIITTGTPAGVIAGMATPRWLAAGDTVRIEMTGLGTMITRVQDEQQSQ